MQHRYLIESSENNRLILFFTGWSTDWHVLENINIPKGYDLICYWDYRDMSAVLFPKVYDEVVVVAWSFGVYAAERLVRNSDFSKKITGLYAINGSRFPVNDSKGIPENIFQPTMDFLDDNNLKKFRFRMSGGKSRYLQVKDKLNTDLTVEELKEELNGFKPATITMQAPGHWDYAFISENDKIFPVSNLINSWSDTPHAIHKNGEHLPDFQHLFNLIIKNKEFIGKNFEKASESYMNNAKVQKRIADRLIELSSYHTVSSRNILEIGGGCGMISQRIRQRLNPKDYTIIDLAENGSHQGVNFIKGDIEIAAPSLSSEYYDLVISGSTLQWLHSPFRIMKEIKRSLKPEGRFLFSTFLEGNLQEIYDLSGNSLLYLTEAQWEMIARNAGFEIEYSEKEETVLLFENAGDVFEHLKATGVNSLSQRNKTVSELRNMLINYPKSEGKYKLTYRTYIMVLK